MPGARLLRDVHGNATNDPSEAIYCYAAPDTQARTVYFVTIAFCSRRFAAVPPARIARVSQTFHPSGRCSAANSL